MILIGQYDSPYVRRVGIAATLYQLPFEHRPWSTFGDADKIRTFNPLLRVPTLVRDDGSVLVESATILDYLDHRVSPDKALVPRDGATRHESLRITAFATGAADKAVSLFYEQRMHAEASTTWVGRCRVQIGGVLALLDAERAATRTTWWFGDALGHADIAVAVVMRFLREVHPGVLDAATYPALAAHAERAEALPVFQQISQPFDAPGV
jgi:glutathione S-transferase